MAIQKAIAIPIYPYNQTVIEQYGNMAILERKTIIIQQIELLFQQEPLLHILLRIFLNQNVIISQ